MTGYQATIVVDDPGGCPVALAAESVDSTVESVSRSSRRDSETVVEEFTIDDPDGELAGPLARTTRDVPGESTDREVEAAPIRTDGRADSDKSQRLSRGSTSGVSPGAVDTAEAEAIDGGETEVIDESISLTPVAGAGSDRTYRFTRDWTTDCVCEVVEAEGNPVSSLRAVDGALHVTVTGPELETLSTTVTALKSSFDGVRLQELTQSTESDENDLVLVDRARLTGRQREVLETAHELGYFEYPKGANASEVADALDISGSTFAEHLGAAQSKLLDTILDE